MRLADKLAVIAGAASAMGAATAPPFAREGAKIVAADLLVARRHQRERLGARGCDDALGPVADAAHLAAAARFNG